MGAEKMTRYETIRRRITTVERNVIQSGYKQSMHDAGFYLPVDDQSNAWIDECGFEHIGVPAKPTNIGRNLGIPYVEIIDDII